MEEWRPIPGFEGHYEVNGEGAVRSVKTKRKRLLKPGFHRSAGSRIYCLSLEGKAVPITGARAVCLAFHGPDLGRSAVHISTDLSDDSVQNVRWS